MRRRSTGWARLARPWWRSKATLADAEEALADARKGGDELELASAKLALVTAEVSLIKAREARTDLDEGPDAAELAVARAAVDEAKLGDSRRLLKLPEKGLAWLRQSG